MGVTQGRAFLGSGRSSVKSTGGGAGVGMPKGRSGPQRCWSRGEEAESNGYGGGRGPFMWAMGRSLDFTLNETRSH